MNAIRENIEYAVNHWWMSLLLGVLFILAGIGVMFTPLTSYIALSIVFSVMLIIGGVLEILFAVKSKKVVSGWRWYLAGGILDLVIGIYLIINPAVSMAVLPYVLAFWLIFRGISVIGYSMDLKNNRLKNWGWWILLGILAIICGIYIFWRPEVGAISIVWIVAYSLIFYGIFRIILAFELRKIRKRLQATGHI